IYLAGSRYLPKNNDTAAETSQESTRGAMNKATYVLLASVIAIVVIFRAAYEQGGNTIALWADTGIDRHIGSGTMIPMTWFQSLNPLMIFLFTPLIVMVWTRRARRGKEPASVTKMAMGAFIVGASYFLLAAVAQGDAASRASWLWLLVFFVVYPAGQPF